MRDHSVSICFSKSSPASLHRKVNTRETTSKRKRTAADGADFVAPASGSQGSKADSVHKIEQEINSVRSAEDSRGTRETRADGGRRQMNGELVSNLAEATYPIAANFPVAEWITPKNRHYDIA